MSKLRKPLLSEAAYGKLDVAPPSCWSEAEIPIYRGRLYRPDPSGQHRVHCTPDS